VDVNETGTDLTVAAAVQRWWRQPDHFEWLSGYLRFRRMLSFTRYLISMIASSLVVAALPLMFTTAGPQGDLRRLLGWAAICGALACATLWLFRWPTKRQSIGVVLIANLCIAVFCEVQSNQLIGLVGATTFAVTGGYIACFHTAGYMLYNFAVAGYIGVLQAVRYGLDGDIHLALAGLVLVLLLNVNVPFALQAVVHALGGDVLRSDRDPLTQLLNRRAFFDQVHSLLLSSTPGHQNLAIAMVDLDRFKHLNDTYGHAVGDQALVAVGEALRRTARPSALVGRIGGEEFLMADIIHAPVLIPLAQPLCDAIESLPYPITASVGIAVGRVDHLRPDEHMALTRDLCRQADMAMYEAKRNGGNQIRQRFNTNDGA
jgi:diguanylate cyclase